MTPLPDEPTHHRRYRVAWEAHRDPDTPKDCLLECQKAMDDAQNEFELEEFHVFQKTLEGHNGYWKKIVKEQRE